MKCPLDKSDMIIVEHRRIELDYCLKCAGVWFDTGELDLLVSVLHSEGAAISAADLLTPQAATVKEARRKCPVCGRNMDKVWLGQDPKVLIDRCPANHGLWFDGGELNQVLCVVKAPGAAGAPDVLSFLGKAFAAGCESPDKKRNK
jgi:Zn-finger nucleic acid-binding protein